MTNSATKLKNQSGHALLLIFSWPDTLVPSTSGWYDGFMQWCGLSSHNRLKVGHNSLALIYETTGNIEYFDFGRYITPEGMGRVRSIETDPHLEFPFKARFDTNRGLSNIDDILLFVSTSKGINGEGRLVASQCSPVDYKRAKGYIQGLRQKGGSIPYGPFVFGGSNCSRFISKTILACCPDFRVRLRILFTLSITPTPLGNVINANTNDTIWQVIDGEITPFKPVNIFAALLNFFDTSDLYYEATLAKQNENLLGIKPDTVPLGAQWLGSNLLGAWFELSTPPELKELEVRIRRYSYKGDLHCDKVFEVREGQISPGASVEFGFDSNCYRCTLFQGSQRIILVAKRDYSDIE